MIIGFAAGSYGANRIEVSDFVSLESAFISKLMKIPDEKGNKECFFNPAARYYHSAKARNKSREGSKTLYI